MAEVWIVSQASLFLVLIGKELTDTTTLFGSSDLKQNSTSAGRTNICNLLTASYRLEGDSGQLPVPVTGFALTGHFCCFTG